MAIVVSRILKKQDSVQSRKLESDNFKNIMRESLLEAGLSPKGHVVSLENCFF